MQNINDFFTATSVKTLFDVVPYQEASPEVQRIYEESMQALGLPFVLNWFKCQGANATLLRGNWEKLRSTLVLGDVPNIVKQLIIYNVSEKKGCSYCARAHGIFANSMGKMFSDDEGFRITDNLDNPLIPYSYRIAVKVVTKAALTPAALSPDDVIELEEAGYSNNEIQELLAQADLVNMLNTIADISGIKVDNELLEIEM